MKTLKTLFLLLICFASFAQTTLPLATSAAADCKCDFKVKGDQVLDGAKPITAVDGTKRNVQPGQTVCFLTGTYSWMYLNNFKGSAAAPITFINMCDGVVKFIAPQTNGSRTIWANNNQFIHFTGTGNPLEQYGFEIAGGGQGIDFRERSSNIELDHTYFHDIGYSAFNAKTDPTCDPATQRGGFTMYNIIFRDNKVERIRTGEGAYVGESHYHDGVDKVCDGKSLKAMEHDVYGVWFYNNTFLNIGRDAIQVGSCLKDCYIYNNTIDGFGLMIEAGQMSGIQINPGTKAEVYNNTISNGPGFGIYSGGTGANYIHDNVISNTGYDTPKAGKKVDGGGIMTAAYKPIDPAGHIIVNNKLINIKRVGLEIYSLTYWINNTVTLAPGAVKNTLYAPASSFLTALPVRTEDGKMQVVDSMNVRKFYFVTPTRRLLIYPQKP